MFKHYSHVELLSSNNDNGRQDEFQMKPKCILIYHIFKYSMTFSNTPAGYATAFSKCNKSVNIRYEVTYEDLYECLTIIDLEKMKVNIKHYLQVTPS